MKDQILFDRVHHGFCDHPVEYPWSSYLTCLSVKPTKLNRNSVIGWFDNEANFKSLHQEKVEVTQIEKWLKIDDLSACVAPDSIKNSKS